ncbi:hypothetical protein ACJMK2_023384 [Sinanodonta woodiana]|uniref:BRCT domain-containing protein n=1 Tax=Sinanodonta woodiana TaxID=1069815 RepID=A0ABD3T4W1_SINWO
MSWPRNVRQSKRRRSEDGKICNDDLSILGDGQTCSSLSLLPEDTAEECLPRRRNRSTKSKDKKKANMKLKNENHVSKVLEAGNQIVFVSANEKIDTASRKSVKDGHKLGSNSQIELLKYIETGICGGRESQSTWDNHVTTQENSLLEHETSVDNDIELVTENLSDSERFDIEVTPNLMPNTNLKETRSNCKFHKDKSTEEGIEAIEFSQTECRVQVTDVSKADSESSGQHSLFKTPFTVPILTNAEVPLPVQSCQTELVDYNEEHDPVTEAILCATPNDNDWHNVDPSIDEHNKAAKTYSRKDRNHSSHSRKVTDWLKSLPGETSEMKAPESIDLIEDKPTAMITMRNRKGKKEDKLQGKIRLLSRAAKDVREDIEHMFGFDDLASNSSQMKKAMKQETARDESRSKAIKTTNMSEEGNMCRTSENIFENMNIAFHKLVHHSSEMVKLYVKDKENENSKQINCNMTSGSELFIKDKPENTRLPVDNPENTRLPVDEPENTHLPVEQPENTRLPVDKPENTQLPVDKPENTRLPVDKPENTQLPVDKPENIRLPVDKPENTRLLVDKPENTRLPAASDKTESTEVQAISDKMVNTGSSIMTVDSRSVPVMPDHIVNIRKTITSDEMEVMGNMKPVVQSETVNTAKAVTLNENFNNYSSMKRNCGSGSGWTVELTKEQRIQLEEPKQPLPLQRRRIFKVMGRSFQPDNTLAQALPKQLQSNETCKLKPVCTVNSALNSDPYEFKASPKATKEQKGKKKEGVKNREKKSNRLKNPMELMIKTVSKRNNMERSQKRNPDQEVMIIQETPDLRFTLEKDISGDDSSDNQVKGRGGQADTNRNIFPTDLEKCAQKKKTSPKIAAAAIKSKVEMQKLVSKISEAEEYDLLTCTQDAVQSLERQQSSHSTTPNVAMEIQDAESIISPSCTKRVRFMDPLDTITVRGQGQRSLVEQGQQVLKGIVKNKKAAKEPHSNNVYKSSTYASVEKTRQVMNEIHCLEDPFEGIPLDDAVENHGCNKDEKISLPQQSCDIGKFSVPEKNCAVSLDSATKEYHHYRKLPVPEKNIDGGRFYMQEEKSEFKNPMWTPTCTRRKTEDDKDDEKEGSDFDDVDADSSTTDDLEIHPHENDFEEPDIAIQTEEMKMKLSETQKSSFSQNSVIDTNKEVMLVEETPAFVMKTGSLEEETLILRTSDPSLTQTPEYQIINEDNMKEMGNNEVPSLATAESLDILENAVNGLIQQAVFDQNNADRKGNINEPCNARSQTFHEIDELEEADQQSTQESLSILAPFDKEISKVQISSHIGIKMNNSSEDEDGMIEKQRLKSKRKCFSLDISPAKVISSKRKAERGRLGKKNGKESQSSEQLDSSSAVLVLETQSENDDKAQKQWVHQVIENQECVPETILDSLGTGSFQEFLEGDILQNPAIKEKFKGSAREDNSSQSETVLESLCQDISVDVNKTIAKCKKNLNNPVASSARAVSGFCPVLNPVPVLETQILDSYPGSYGRTSSLEHTSGDEMKNKNLNNIEIGKNRLKTLDGRNSVNKFSGKPLETFTDLELKDTEMVESLRDKAKTDAQNFKAAHYPLNSFGTSQIEAGIERDYSPEDIFQMDSEVPMLVGSSNQYELDSGNEKYPLESKSAMEKNESKSTLEELSELDFGEKSLQPVTGSLFHHLAVNNGSSVSPVSLSRKSSRNRQGHTTEKNQEIGIQKQAPVGKLNFKSESTSSNSSPGARALRSRIVKQTPSSSLESSLPCGEKDKNDSSNPVPMNSPHRLGPNFHKSTIHGRKEKMQTPPLHAKSWSIDSDSDSDLSQELRKRRKSGIRGVRGFSSKKCKQDISGTSDGSLSLSAKSLIENASAAVCRFDSEGEKVSNMPTLSKMESSSIVNLGCEYQNTGKTSAVSPLNGSLKYQNATNTIDAYKQDVVLKKRMNNDERISLPFVRKSPNMSQQTSTNKCFLHEQSEIDHKAKGRSWNRKPSPNKLKNNSEMICISLDDIELMSHTVDIDVIPSEIIDKPHRVDIKPMNHVERQDNPLNLESLDEPHCLDVQPLDNELHEMKADFDMEACETQQRNELHTSVVKPPIVDRQSKNIHADQQDVDSETVQKNSQEDVHVDVTVPDSYPTSGSFQVQSQSLSMTKSRETHDLKNESICAMIDSSGEAVQRCGMKTDQVTKMQNSEVPVNNNLLKSCGDYNDSVRENVTDGNDNLSPDDKENVDTIPNFEFQDELSEEHLNLSDECTPGDVAACEDIGHEFETISPIPKITGAKVIEINGSDVDDDYESDEPVRSKRQRTRVLEDTDSDDAKSQDSITSHYINLTSSSAISSQSETLLTTQQRDILEKDLDRMRKEMQEIEAQLAANRLSSRKSDSWESRKWSCNSDDPSPLARRNLLSEERMKDASVKEINLGKDNDIVDVEFIADYQRKYLQKQVAEPSEIDKDSHIETEDSEEDSDDLFLSPLSPESLPSPVGPDRSRTPISDIMQNVENLFSEIREQMGDEDECQSPDEKGRIVMQERRNITSQKSPTKRPPLNDIVQISSNVPQITASRPCVRGFVASGLSVGQAQEVRKLASLNDCKFYNTFNCSVSHVIVRPDKQNIRLCDRTLKFFQGIAHHCWIVSFQWVVDSRTAGHLLPEDAYEIQGDTANGNIHFGPKRSRLSNSLLVEKFAFYCTGESPGLTAEDMRGLLEESGGTIIPDVSQLSSSDKIPLIIACSEWDEEEENKELIQREISKFNEIYKKQHVVTLSREWVLDSLTLYRLQPFEEYVLTTVKNIKLPKIS